MKIWIARDKDSRLYLFDYKPIRDEDDTQFIYDDTYIDSPIFIFGYIEIDKTLFPEVTWENSPKQVEFKLID